jgi:hypothetical protein
MAGYEARRAKNGHWNVHDPQGMIVTNHYENEHGARKQADELNGAAAADRRHRAGGDPANPLVDVETVRIVDEDVAPGDPSVTAWRHREVRNQFQMPWDAAYSWSIAMTRESAATTNYTVQRMLTGEPGKARDSEVWAYSMTLIRGVHLIVFRNVLDENGEWRPRDEFAGAPVGDDQNRGSHDGIDG